jgi:hypothetical protein
VPFTLSHSAAALPFRRSPLIPSALIIGTFAPDFQYFIRLEASGRFGHSLVGAVVLTLPIALAVLWLFHAVVKIPVVRLLPDGLQRRLAGTLGKFRFWPVSRFLLVAFSTLVGIGTHILWDSFTHAQGWFCRHWAFLRGPVDVPVLGTIPWFKVLQHSSTIAGLVMLAIWFVRWYQSTKPEPARQMMRSSSSRSSRTAIVVFILFVAITGAIVRAMWGTAGLPLELSFRRFAAESVITAVVLIWWQFVIYGIIQIVRGQNSSALVASRD